ncbi:hypothetical protein [Flavobacterium sp. CS20]|jgi:hypothetical protein|uniref:hypothetical protein n=1 Tax=Flavobacterium sp. CS20 TaxID=2775246 RepID=UPI001B3A1E3C|nr:hypothetical protein [Flavobacterium sp. CS20]QTY27511.1 hypothetical protein IGB25_02870 [Flavobacterium sp. CS20]
MEFNPKQDKIAVVVKSFTLKRKSEFFLERFSEPYIVSMAIDEHGAYETSIDFNILSFPNVKKGDTVSFDGQGHLIYGPKNPGQFLAYSVLFMESDKDVRDFGQLMEDILKSEAINLGAKALLKAAPTYSTAINLLQNLTELIAKQLQKNKDDELFRRNGTLLRDVKPPYDILRSYDSENDFIKTKTSVIPLDVSNKLGSQTKALQL